VSETPQADKALENQADGTSPAQADQPAAAKKDKPVKPPKLEDKPFTSFIQDDLIPCLLKGLQSHGITPESLELVQGERPVVGGDCWMVTGSLPPGRRFWLCFNDDSINAGKTFALADPGTEPSLLESFLIDEKRMSLPLRLSRLLQRLNGQKWLGGN
jgi:hypothetical protein